MHICIFFLGHFVFTTTLIRNLSKHRVCLASQCLVISNQIAASRAEHDVTDTSMAMPSNKVVTNANIKLNFNLILHQKTFLLAKKRDGFCFNFLRKHSLKDFTKERVSIPEENLTLAVLILWNNMQTGVCFQAIGNSLSKISFLFHVSLLFELIIVLPTELLYTCSQRYFALFSQLNCIQCQNTSYTHYFKT